MKKTILITLALLCSTLAMGQKPETIVTFVAHQYEPEWYEAQAQAWQKVVDQDPQNQWAWRNLFRATYYYDLFHPGGGPNTEDVVRRMQAAVPDSYVSNLCRLSYCLPDDSLARTSIPAQRAIELMPADACSEDIAKLACRMWQSDPDNAQARELFAKAYKMQHFPYHMMRANANMLESVQPDAIYFANGDAVTMPMKMLQDALGMRTDVLVVPISYLYDDDFRSAVWKKLNIKPFIGDYHDYFARDIKRGGRQYEADVMMHIARESKRPTYFSVYNISYTELDKDSLYNEGLLLKWSDHPYDNFAVAMNNVKNVYHLEYLAEPKLVYNPWQEGCDRLDLSHINLLAHLVGKFRAQGDVAQANRLLNTLQGCLDHCEEEPERKAHWQEILDEQSKN